MTSDQISNSVLAAVAVLSLLSIYLTYHYRKKEFQIVLLQEQLKTYRELIAILFQTNKKFSEIYNQTMGIEILINPDSFDKIEELQNDVFIKFGPYYDANYFKFQSLIFLLPEDVIDSTMEYFNYLSDLFENENDSELGVKMLTEGNQKVFDVINTIRNHIAIDDLSEQTRNLLSKKQQLQFVDEDENDNEVK